MSPAPAADAGIPGHAGDRGGGGAAGPGERLSAAAALLALIAAAGLALIGIAVHLLAILIVTAGLLICVMSCWYVVSRRGPAPADRARRGRGGRWAG